MATVERDFWKYIALSILGMLGSWGTILADTFFISHHLGADGLAHPARLASTGTKIPPCNTMLSSVDPPFAGGNPLLTTFLYTCRI